jgi:hypothetical protein
VLGGVTDATFSGRPMPEQDPVAKTKRLQGLGKDLHGAEHLQPWRLVGLCVGIWNLCHRLSLRGPLLGWIAFLAFTLPERHDPHPYDLEQRAALTAESLISAPL